MSLSKIIAIASKIPPEAYVAVYDALVAIVESDDPKRTAERAAIAASGKVASQSLVRKLLKLRSK